MKLICDVCDISISGGYGREHTCCTEHAKLIERYHGNLDRAREQYQQDQERNRIIDSFIYARVKDD